MEPVSKQGRDGYFCCTDCNLTVHENDRENHINGGRHQFKIRQKGARTNQPDHQFECDVCNTKFTDIHFYTIHQGSKTHKRNLKRIKKSNKAPSEGRPESVVHPTTFTKRPRRVQIQGIDSYVSVNDFRDICDYKGTREKYRTRNTKNPEGNNKIYICSVTAYWAVSLALERAVQDFKICLNDKEWGDFGDAVVEIELKETQDRPGLLTTFAIQFKDVSNNPKKIESVAEGKFGFGKYVSQISAIKSHKNAENLKFIIFTTALTEANMVKQTRLRHDILHKTRQECTCEGEEKEIFVVTKTLSNRRRLLINTSDDNDNTYFFFCTDNMHVLPRIYMYTHQKKQKHFGAWIDELVSGSLGYGDRKVDIHREFIKYVEYWSDGYLGGSYKLKKEDVLVKLGHLLLYKFKVPPVVQTPETKNFVIWQQAVNSVDITIVKQHPSVISKICQPVNVKIETELDLKIDTTTNSISLEQSTIKKIENPVLKMYLFEETMEDIKDDIPLDIVYDFFWKAGLIPFVLKVDCVKDQEQILNIVSLLKSLGLTRRYFLMSSDENIKNSLRYHKSLTFFVHVDDIAPKIPALLLDNVKINVTDQFSLSLKSIQESDLFFQKTVSAHEFFDMSLGKYSFKPFGNNLARKDGQDTQLVLADDLMAKLKEEVESKNEMKMIYLKNGNEGNNQFLRGIKPDLFC